MSISHEINAERLVLVGWSRAILLQMAHPLIAAGVARHSSFRDSPVASARRLHQTVRAMLGLTFGSETARARVIAEIRAIHRRVNGALRETVGRFPAGTTYSAEDPSLLLWVHATMVESTVLAYEAIVAELPPPRRDAYCDEAAPIALALGARPEEVPRDWARLRSYMQTMYESGTLSVGADARAIAQAVLQGRLSALAGPVAWANRRFTAGWLPPDSRRQYGFEWGAKEERQFAWLSGRVRGLRRTLPRSIALWPESRVKG